MKFLFLTVSLFCVPLTSGQTSCIKTYSNLAINGNDIHGVQGSSSSCCQYCQQIRGCQAYTWNTFNGGTCWLKNDTQPLYNSTGEYSGILSPGANHTYSLFKSYDASNWFSNDTFEFNSYYYKDHKFGFVNYIDYEKAKSAGLVGVQNGKVYMGMDNTTILPPNSTIGRSAIRINTLIRFYSGLFIFDIDHMPTGPGLWPSFWTDGPDWPYNGEIDVLEGISERNFNQITLHTGENCAMQANDSRYFTGKWNYGHDGLDTDCYARAHGNPHQIQNGTGPVRASRGQPGSNPESNWPRPLFDPCPEHRTHQYPDFWTEIPSPKSQK
uniref:GH16 domain-containing protein n=1 Tax=Acrobeloides nanus TaxID=290746 RepID=A0A914CGK7_9BILA